MKEKVVLAYSGGLDTTAIIPWLKETYGYEVVCCCINCGQGEELDGLEERAKLSGASKLYIEDITDEFCDDYIVPCVQAGAVYEHKYLLGTAMARPGIAKKLVEIARKENAVAICHGATGKGNDQIRFELGIKALAPDIKIIAPWRDDKWQMDSREAEIAYCKAHGIDLPFGTDQSYSRDRNLWHISHEGLELENPANEPNYDHLLVLGVSPEKAPDEGEYVTMTFEKGVPKTVNGKEMKVSDIIRELNRLGGKHGVGIIEQRLDAGVPVHVVQEHFLGECTGALLVEAAGAGPGHGLFDGVGHERRVEGQGDLKVFEGRVEHGAAVELLLAQLGLMLVFALGFEGESG